MVRLRGLQLLLLLFATVVVVVHGNMDPSWSHCGILTFCIAHNTCFKSGSNKGKEWATVRNLGNLSAVMADPADYDGNCDRYITIRPEVGGKVAMVKMKYQDKDAQDAFIKKNLRVWLPMTGSLNLNVLCVNEHISPAEHLQQSAFTFEEQFGVEKGAAHCFFAIKASDDTDIRVKITAAVGKKLFVSGGNDINARHEVTDVDLTKLRIPCQGKEITAVSPSLTALDGDEISNHTVTDLVPSTKNRYCHVYHRDRNDECKVIDEDAKVQCPLEYPMKHRIGLEGPWKYVKDGLVCHRGYLTHSHDSSIRVSKDDGIKCSRKKCSTCDAPSFNHKREEHFDTPVFEPAVQGDQCRTLKCPSHSHMIVTLQGQTSPLIHKSNTLTCSPSNRGMFDKNWLADGDQSGLLVDALCADDIYCSKMHPLKKQSCKKGDEQCYEAFIHDKYENTMPCPDNYTLLYIAAGSGNKVLLSDFYCKTENGRWVAKDLRRRDVTVVDNSSLVCKMNEKEKYVDQVVDVFLGSTAFWVFLAGIFLVVIAIVVVGAFLIVRSKKTKERKKKAMASVSQTYKEHKHKKGKHSHKKKRPKSNINSVTGDTNSEPNSQSGGGSTAGSAPIAPPSKLIPPGFAKPDKGCAVLDLNTGQSKNLRWTNHLGTGPPTQKQEDSANWAASNSKQDDVQSAIKFAPEEVEALRRAKNQKKEKSKQKSLEYNLGTPKPVNYDYSKIKNLLGDSNNADDSTIKQ